MKLTAAERLYHWNQRNPIWGMKQQQAGKQEPNGSSLLW